MKGILLPVTLLCAWFATVNQASAQVTAFNYQGRLTDGGAPANGNFDLLFTLYDAAGGANVIGGPLTNAATAVSAGLFSASLDFGSGAFTGGDRWLEVAVHASGGGQFVALIPRQRITASPYAVYAGGVASSGGTLTNLNASALASGTVPPARLASGPGSASTWLRGDQAWSAIHISDVLGLDTNRFANIDDRRVLTFSNAVSQIGISNLWTANWIGKSYTGSGSFAWTNGALYFNYPQVNQNYIFLNPQHGGGLDGSELELTANLIYIGPTEGGHLQIGLSSQRRIVMYLQSAVPDYGAPNFHKQQSHQLGFRYGVQYPPTYIDYDLLQWNINATNYDNSARGSAHAKLIIWSPILTGTAADTALGTNIFNWDSHGWTALQSQHTFYSPGSANGTNYIVDCFRDMHSLTLDTNVNITLTNLILTNEAQRIDLFLYPGGDYRSVMFPTANWIWESEGGSIPAPVDIAPFIMMHVTLFATGGTTTNIIASYKQGPYSPGGGFASAKSVGSPEQFEAASTSTLNRTGELQAVVSRITEKLEAQEKLAAEREAVITRLERRLAQLEAHLTPQLRDGDGQKLP